MRQESPVFMTHDTSTSEKPHTAAHGANAGRLAIVMKGYPRLSETFIAQELLALQQKGLAFEIWSLRHPYDDKSHPMHAQITAPVRYLPEYLHDDWGRVARGFLTALKNPRSLRLLAVWLNDLRRDMTANRVRRLGQALVLARELPQDIAALYVHFLHTPASVTRYAAILRDVPWSFSAHAKDIWTSPDWEKREKIAASSFGVTCTGFGAEHLSGLADLDGKIDLIYHGIDLSRFPAPPERDYNRALSLEAPFEVLSVGRLVEKKGYDLLLQALAALPVELPWRFVHIGGGELKDKLRTLADELSLTDRIDWRGPADQTEVVAAMRSADLFVLPSRIAGSGDRDGLPNVLMEAASQKLPIVSSHVSAIPEFIHSGVHGTLVPEADVDALGAAIQQLATDPERRRAYAEAAFERLSRDFAMQPGLDRLYARLDVLMAPGEAPHGSAQTTDSTDEHARAAVS